MPARYFVTDVSTALRFYTEVLQFELVEQWGPAFAIVRKADVSLWLSGPGTSAALVSVNGESPTPGGWSRIVVEVDDLDAVLPRIDQEHFLAPVTSGPGGKQALVRDPDGNHIELFQGR